MFQFIKKRKRNKLSKAEYIKLKSMTLSIKYQELALNSSSKGVSKNDNSPPIIVSLTTFSKRINDVFLTIESLFQQSRKADKIILWISKEEFTQADIPASLILQMSRGLEIEFCEKDLGPYTKFYYTLKKYPDSLILTVDDDILYPADMIDQLVRAYIKEPTTIHCHRAHKILRNKSGNILPYEQWDQFTKDKEASLSIFPTGVCGVLYFPGCFDHEILNQELFIKLAPKADDIWLKAMSLKKGTLCKKIDDHRDWRTRFVIIDGSQEFALKNENTGKANGNDPKIEAVFNYYQLNSSF